MLRPDRSAVMPARAAALGTSLSRACAGRGGPGDLICVIVREATKGGGRQEKLGGSRNESSIISWGGVQRVIGRCCTVAALHSSPCAAGDAPLSRSGHHAGRLSLFGWGRAAPFKSSAIILYSHNSLL